ncbi:hypothetical protein T4B_14781 [Trichinella pseudospiralis]|uniref:Uncharacterized protein n=1 Tax=Trichinella pseudospiralis TaxID=6337 RepID=A0A0V1G780_TRIPS|nr:hypothetical protein T4B_14781 [Trichinella pseudospiralis]KRY97126.1 hypothetical protein T4C_8708 [Trichinella pseudospiralis]
MFRSTLKMLDNSYLHIWNNCYLNNSFILAKTTNGSV